MTAIKFNNESPFTTSIDALVIGAVQCDKHHIELLANVTVPRDVIKSLDFSLLSFSAKPDEVLFLPAPKGLKAKVLVVAGLGSSKDLSAEGLRRAAGSVTQQNRSSAKTIGFALPAKDEAATIAVAQGASLGAYRYTAHQSNQAASPGLSEIQVFTPLAKELTKHKASDQVATLVSATNLVRDLVNAPPNELYPESFVSLTKTALRGTPIKITVLDEKALAQQGYGGILAVGQGSARPPRLVKLSYNPSHAAKHCSFVGKGITFDSGGLSLKPAKSMETMKSDMAGAATALAIIVAAAKLKLNVRITAILCLAENMPSGSAQRPSDVIVAKGGKTIEVLNTDAEGRLVLADGLVTAESEHPDYMIDLATLTGAQVVALGTRISAIMGNDAALSTALQGSAEATGEQIWPMPLPTELRPSLDSRIADIANIGDRFGGMLVAGLFLKEFVSETPWAHLDIAGPAFNEGPAYGYTPSGGTGVMVRTALDFLRSLEK